MKPNVLIVGAGSVAHVAAHKAAQHNDLLGDICIASRRVEKCERIIESVRRKGSLKDPSGAIYGRAVDAMDVPALARLIRDTSASIVVNLGTPYINMSVLEACLATRTTYLDTAIHEEPEEACEDPPWYANYEWKRKARCGAEGVNAILSVGFDPGVVNAYCAMAAKHHFDAIDMIDILDVNAGSHGRFFATNYDPEINLRVFKKVWAYVNRQWVSEAVHTVRRDYDFPVVGRHSVYLTAHDEVHSLASCIDASTIRFWMGFDDHYINCLNVLKNVGLLSEEPVRTVEGVEIVPLKVLKACLPDPLSLAPDYTGSTCIGTLIKGVRHGIEKEIFIYNVCDHPACYAEVEAHAVSYTAGVPPIAAAILVATGVWNPRTMVNVEELDPDPFIDLVGRMGLPTHVEDRTAVAVGRVA